MTCISVGLRGLKKILALVLSRDLASHSTYSQRPGIDWVSYEAGAQSREMDTSMGSSEDKDDV